MNYYPKHFKLENAEDISLEFLRSYFQYDPLTGEITRSKVWAPSQSVGQPVGGLNKLGYVKITIYGGQFLAHRLIRFYVIGEWPQGEIDHVNRNRADNRWSNLRDASRVTNGINRSINKNNVSGFQGVSYRAKEAKWQATGRAEGKNVNLGLFDNPEEAGRVAADFRAKQYGVYAPEYIVGV